MPQPGRAEALSFLRGRIARIEAGQPPETGVEDGPARLLSPRRDAFYEIAPAAGGDMGAASGFALMLAGRFRRETGKPLLWIAHDFAVLEQGLPWGAGLEAYGVPLDAFVLMRLRQPLDIWRAMEEAVKAAVFALVIAEPAALTGEDLPALVRRLTLCARTHGSRALLLRPPSRAPFLSPSPMRFEIAARPASRDLGLARPLPGPAAWRLRHCGAPGSLQGVQPQTEYAVGFDVSSSEKAYPRAALPFDLSSAA